MAKLIGNNPSQIPTNGDLGSMAFEDRKNYATINSSIHQPFRNIIINGDMSIAQRGTSASGLTNGNSGYHTVDRFAFSEGGSPTGVFTMSQVTDVPTGQGFAKSLKMDCTTADTSLASTDTYGIMTKFEGQMLQYLKKGTANAESWTLSFWVKSNKTGTYSIWIYDQDNGRTTSKSYTINNSSTWEKKIITFAGDTTGAFDNDNAMSMYIEFNLGTGTTYNSGTLQTSWGSYAVGNRYSSSQVNLADSTSNYINITGVQLEAGTTASDFEFLPVDVNLERCLRYYNLIAKGDTSAEYFSDGHYYSSGNVRGTLRFSQTMRTSPTLDQNSGTNYYIIFRNNGNDTFNSFTVVSNTRSSLLYNNTEVNGTTGQAGAFRTNDTNAYIAFDAEL